MATYIWQRADWAAFRWDAGVLLPLLGRCRKRQGKLLAEVTALGSARWSTASSMRDGTVLKVA